MVFWKIKSIPIVLTFIISTSAFSQSLTPETNFGNAGRVLTNYSNDAVTYSSCIASQDDGKIVIGGNVIVRVLPDGRPDSTFNNDGIYADPYFTEAPRSIAVQPDGKMIALYHDVLKDSLSFLKRLNVNGTPDSTFGQFGILSIGVPSIKVNCYKNILQPDGKMIVVGSADSAGTINIFIARILQTGLPDTGFNHSGINIIGLPGGTAFGYRVAVQYGGGIVITGQYTDNTSGDVQVFVIRLSSNGIFDNAFNTTGIYLTNGLVLGGINSTAITVQPDDKILVGGSSNAQIMAIRLKADGTADTSFNSTGIAYNYIGELNNTSGIFIRPGGKILMAVETVISQSDPSSWNYGAIQLNPDGSLDNSFNGDGKMYKSLSVVDHCVGAVLQANGNLVLSGYANEFSLISMIGVDSFGVVDNSFGSGGIKILQLLGTDETVISLMQQQDKKIIAAGSRKEGILDKAGIILVRYQPDGKSLDSTFGNNGKVGIVKPNTFFRSAFLQKNGKAVVCGTTYDPNTSRYQTEIFRLTETGNQDNTFATTTNFAFNSDPVLRNTTGNNMAIQDDDYIVVGQNLNTAHNYIRLVRLTNDGDLDVFFGDNGKMDLKIDTASYLFNSIAVQSDSNIIIAADQKIDDTTTGFALLRVLPYGDLDNSFDGEGIKTLPMRSYYSGKRNDISMAVQPDDKIIVGTNIIHYDEATDTYSSSIAINRVNKDGSADTTFNKTGTLMFPANDRYSFFLYALTLRRDSIIYIAGDLSDSTGAKPFLIRITPDGRQDSTISSDGTGILITEKNQNGLINDLKVLQDSTILAGGYLDNGKKGNDLLLDLFKYKSPTVYRFIGDGSWTLPENWENGIIPPAVLPAGGFIFIQPVNGGKCILDTVQHVSSAACIVVLEGKNLVINGSLLIDQ